MNNLHKITHRNFTEKQLSQISFIQRMGNEVRIRKDGVVERLRFRNGTSAWDARWWDNSFDAQYILKVWRNNEKKQPNLNLVQYE